VASTEAVFGYGLIPARLFGEAELNPQIASAPAWATVITSIFLHGGLLHLGSNMLFLWIFGDNVEDSMGRVRYLFFYLVCGAAAGLSHALIDPDSVTPTIGASGAVSGILGAYILLHPRATIRTILFLGFIFTIVHVPALIVLGVWFFGQLINALSTPADVVGVAFWAHIGGFGSGLLLVVFFKRREVSLFQAPRSSAFELERTRYPWR
jgi:membrane associated rhomboid family serine protease